MAADRCNRMHVQHSPMMSAFSGTVGILGKVGKKCLLSGVEQTHFAVAASGCF